MIWQAAKAEAIGGRKEQQDRVELFESRDGSERLLVLADGMGGHSGGAIAADAVVETARSLWRKHILQPLAPEQLLRANWAHVGDSRLYRFRGSDLVGRTLDHSVVQMLVDMGKVDEEEMATHPDQNRLTQSLGGDSDPEPDLESARVEMGDGFVLCSDGLWERVTTDEMLEALGAEVLNVEAKRLVELAADRGGADGDNVTIALARTAADKAEKRRGGGLFGLFSS